MLVQTKINSYSQAHSNQQRKSFIEAALKAFSPIGPMYENAASLFPVKGWYNKKSETSNHQDISARWAKK